MKIVFVENRFKTAFWELIAKEYQLDGHEIYWIVQNPLFKPSFGDVYTLPFPEGRPIENTLNDQALEKIILSNRGLKYFKIESNNFIFHYKQEIDQIVEKINPDFVFGESTMFHELLVINSCKKRGIKYLHPTSCRYPSERFSFYLYDSLKPYSGSNEKLKRNEVLELIQSISSRKIQPDYINKKSNKNYILKKLKSSITLFISYYLGEKYNTPSPLRKFKLERERKRNILRWEEMSDPIEMINLEEVNILYAFQMQPEANIDVWGYPFSNQLEVIKEICSSLKEGEKLILKPNPKSKYEISEELLLTLKSLKEKVVILSHSIKMETIWDKLDVIVTVTGTIGIEAFLSNKPCLILGDIINSERKSINSITLQRELRDLIDSHKSGQIKSININQKIELIDYLTTTSFKGVIGDGLTNRAHIFDRRNRINILKAFKTIIG